MGVRAKEDDTKKAKTSLNIFTLRTKDDQKRFIANVTANVGGPCTEVLSYQEKIYTAIN
jgi:hypothetical protein